MGDDPENLDVLLAGKKKKKKKVMVALDDEDVAPVTGMCAAESLRCCGRPCCGKQRQ